MPTKTDQEKILTFYATMMSDRTDGKHTLQSVNDYLSFPWVGGSDANIRKAVSVAELPSDVHQMLTTMREIYSKRGSFPPGSFLTGEDWDLPNNRVETFAIQNEVKLFKHYIKSTHPLASNDSDLGYEINDRLVEILLYEKAIAKGYDATTAGAFSKGNFQSDEPQNATSTAASLTMTGGLKEKLESFDFKDGKGSFEDYRYLVDNFGNLRRALQKADNPAHTAAWDMEKQLLTKSLTDMGVAASEYKTDGGYDVDKALQLFKQKWNANDYDPKFAKEDSTLDSDTLRAVIRYGAKADGVSDADREKLKSGLNRNNKVVSGKTTDKPVTDSDESKKTDSKKETTSLTSTGLTVPQKDSDINKAYIINLQKALYSAGYYSTSRIKGDEKTEWGKITLGTWTETDERAFREYLKEKGGVTLAADKPVSIEHHQLVAKALSGESSSVTVAQTEKKKETVKPVSNSDETTDTTTTTKKKAETSKPLDTTALSGDRAAIEKALRDRLAKMDKNELVDLMVAVSLLPTRERSDVALQTQNGPMGDYLSIIERMNTNADTETMFRTPNFVGDDTTIRTNGNTEFSNRNNIQKASNLLFEDYSKRGGGGNPLNGVLGSLGSIVSIGGIGGGKSSDNNKAYMDNDRLAKLLEDVYPGTDAETLKTRAQALLDKYDNDVKVGKEGKKLEANEFSKLLADRIFAGDPDWINFAEQTANLSLSVTRRNVSRDSDLTERRPTSSRTDDVVDQFERETDAILIPKAVSNLKTNSETEETDKKTEKVDYSQSIIVNVPGLETDTKTSNAKTSKVNPIIAPLDEREAKSVVDTKPKSNLAATNVMFERGAGLGEMVDKRNEVKDFQRLMIASGFLSDKFLDDGRFGENTGNAAGAANRVFFQKTSELGDAQLVDTLSRYVLGQEVTVDGKKVQLSGDERRQFIEAYAKKKGDKTAVREMNAFLDDVKQRYDTTNSQSNNLRERDYEKETYSKQGMESVQKDLAALEYLGTNQVGKIGDQAVQANRIAMGQFIEAYNGGRYNIVGGQQVPPKVLLKTDKGVISDESVAALKAEAAKVQEQSQSVQKTAQVLNQADQTRTQVRLEDVPGGELLGVIDRTIAKGDRDRNGALDQRELSDTLGISLSEAEKLTKDVGLGKQIGERDLLKIATDETIRNRIGADSLEKIERLVADANVNLRGVTADITDLDARLTDKEIKQTQVPFGAKTKTGGGISTT